MTDTQLQPVSSSQAGSHPRLDGGRPRPSFPGAAHDRGVAAARVLSEPTTSEGACVRIRPV